MAQRKTEVDAINGMVPETAKHLGLSAPYSEVITAIIMTKQSDF